VKKTSLIECDAQVSEQGALVFKRKRLADEYKVDYLGALPLNLSIRVQADSGRPTVVSDPDGTIAGVYKQVARRVAVKIAERTKDFSSKFPTISVSKDT